MGPCSKQAPPDSFSPEVQWSWAGMDGEDQVAVVPLVANLTDDNGDGAIDLCDVPDIVVVAYEGDPALSFLCDLPDVADAPPNCIATIGHIYVLDGATGAVHFKVPTDVHAWITPAIGDIDQDGVPEIVTAIPDVPPNVHDSHLVAFEHDGSLAWESADSASVDQSTIALADLDVDGDVEIVRTHGVTDHLGQTVATFGFGADEPLVSFSLTAIADLDGDEDLEIIGSNRAWHHDGTPFVVMQSQWDSTIASQVADLDLDGSPEIINTGYSSVYGFVGAFHTDGSPFSTGEGALSMNPAAVHDVDGDGVPNVLVAGTGSFSALAPDLGIRWTSGTEDLTGLAGATAFDFLGDGTAEAVYADETQLHVYDGQSGTEVLTWPRTSWTNIEYPVVADVDDDGSAEIVVVSNLGYYAGEVSPAVQVIRDAQDRWVPARRIWNQHAYHVTNVREDGTIPQMQPKNWLTLNTYRVQAQIEPGGQLCQPEPEG